MTVLQFTSFNFQMRLFKYYAVMLYYCSIRSRSMSMSHYHGTANIYEKTTRSWISNFVANPKLQLCPWAASTLISNKLRMVTYDYNYVRFGIIIFYMYAMELPD